MIHQSLKLIPNTNVFQSKFTFNLMLKRVNNLWHWNRTESESKHLCHIAYGFNTKSCLGPSWWGAPLCPQQECCGLLSCLALVGLHRSQATDDRKPHMQTRITLFLNVKACAILCLMFSCARPLHAQLLFVLRLLLNHSLVSSHVTSLLRPLCPGFRFKPWPQP